MITVRINPGFFTSIFTQDRTIKPLKVLKGLPEGATLLGCHIDPQRGVVLLQYADGKPENVETEITFGILELTPK